MGADTKIEWCHATFNPWRGCTKVSPGCTNCYAEMLSHRNPGVLGIWGDKGTRVVAAEAQWREPLKWDRAAKAAGERHRVFCASLADVFEDRPELVAPRVRLFHLINDTSNLDWLLLTKRPENIRRLSEAVPGSWSLTTPPNVWLGTSVENQATANERIPHLLNVPAAVHFLSMEPLLGPVDLSQHWYTTHNWHNWLTGETGLGRTTNNFGSHKQTGRKLSWVIIGGESGPKARPMHPDWARSIRDQCVSAGVAFHFKQHGEWATRDSADLPGTCGVHESKCMSHLGKLDDGPTCFGPKRVNILRVGKKVAGRVLDGRTWDEVPTPGKAVA